MLCNNEDAVSANVLLIFWKTSLTRTGGRADEFAEDNQSML